MTYAEWYKQNYGDVAVSSADYTFGEEVWQAAQQHRQQTHADWFDETYPDVFSASMADYDSSERAWLASD